MENDNLVTFLDAIGRTLFAEQIPDRCTDEEFVVKNPVVVNIATTPDNKMSLQLLPVFFKEFLGDKDDDVVFTYNRQMVTIADKVAFDFKLHNNYKQMFSNIILPDADPVKGTQSKKVIDLFDETSKATTK